MANRRDQDAGAIGLGEDATHVSILVQILNWTVAARNHDCVVVASVDVMEDQRSGQAIGDRFKIAVEMIDIFLPDDGRVHAVRIDRRRDATRCRDVDGAAFLDELLVHHDKLFRPNATFVL